jgi:hypothetical protein
MTHQFAFLLAGFVISVNAFGSHMVAALSEVGPFTLGRYAE